MNELATQYPILTRMATLPCPSCHEERPTSNFLIVAGVPVICGFCAKSAKRAHQALKVVKKNSDKLRRVVREALKGAEDTPTMEKTFTSIVGIFGGVDGFTRAWYDDYLATKAGTGTRMQCYRDVLKLGQSVSEALSRKTDLTKLTEEELEAALDHFMRSQANGDGDDDESNDEADPDLEFEVIPDDEGEADEDEDADDDA